MRLAAVFASVAISVFPAAALAQQPSSLPETVQKVIYIEVRPSQIPKALKELKQQVLHLKQAQSDLSVALLQELDRPNQYVLLVSNNNANHSSFANLTSDVQINISPLQILPEFLLESIPMVGSTKLRIPLEGFVMVAHLDADPSQADQTRPQLNELLRIIPSLSGNQGVQVLTWKKRTNHWTLVESWKTRQDFYSSIEDPRVQAIRAAIASHAAAPSDLRLYRRVD